MDSRADTNPPHANTTPGWRTLSSVAQTGWKPVLLCRNADDSATRGAPAGFRGRAVRAPGATRPVRSISIQFHDDRVSVAHPIRLGPFVADCWEVPVCIRKGRGWRTPGASEPKLVPPPGTPLLQPLRRLISVPWLILLVCVLGFNCHAHKLSDAHLRLEVTNQTLVGQWDIALRDLEDAIGLDADGDRAITWGEVRARHNEIADFALQHLQISAAGEPISLVVGEQMIDEHSDGAFSVLRFSGALPAVVADLTIDYSLLFEFCPLHRGLLQVRHGDVVQTAVLGPSSGGQTFELAQPDRTRQFLTFVKEGVHHIWIGIDHVLFLLALLIPAVLWRREPATSPGSGVGRPGEFRPVLLRVIKLVTAFTIAHSLTLTLATLDLVNLPSRLIETVIAASVVVAAVNNLWPFFRDRGAWIVFVFGLVHGFGFASVLGDLGLPAGARALSLGGFNVGVELGQLAIVALFLPPAFLLRDTRFYRQVVRVGGSAAIALVASAWFAERAFELSLLPF